MVARKRLSYCTVVKKERLWMPKFEQEVELLPGGEEGEVLKDGGEEDAELQSSQTLPQTNPSSPAKW
jgi:hypothetical protein